MKRKTTFIKLILSAVLTGVSALANVIMKMTDGSVRKVRVCL